MIKNVVVVGGTHGNEYTGIFFANYLKTAIKLLENYSFKVTTLIANPLAFKENKRFIDHDLNRSFHNNYLESNDDAHERKLACDLINNKALKNCDFLIDLHTTTANMGKTIVLSKTDKISVQCAYYLQRKFPDLKIIEASNVDDQSPFVNKVSKSGLLIEVGPTPQGLLRPQVFQDTQEIVLEIFNFLNSIQSESDLDSDCSNKFRRYKIFENLHYPQDPEGNITGMIHPSIENKNFEKIINGSPLFYLFNGETIYYKGESFYSIFINEAAYFNDKIALMKCNLV
jgi:aspartoacylase